MIVDSRKQPERCFVGKALPRKQICLIRRVRYVKSSKKIKTIYRNLPTKNIVELKPWDLVDVYLIGPYSKSIRQHQAGVAIISKHLILTCMTIIDTTTGCIENIKIKTFGLAEVTADSDEYIYK